MMAGMATMDDRTAQVFQDALETFDRTFTDEEKTTFANFRTAEQMTHHVLEESRKRPTFKDGPVQKFCHATARLSASLGPYFIIISTFVQSDPRIAGLIWGSLFLVFRLSEHHASFMVRLSEVLTRVADELKVFSRHADSLDQAARERAVDSSCPTNPRLHQAISKVYIDLIEFCQQVRQLLSGTKLRHRLRITRSIMWKPFDAHFAELLTKMRHHKELVQLELHTTSTEELLAQYKKVEEILTNIEENVDEQTHGQHGLGIDIAHIKMSSLKSWINPPQWEASLEGAKAKRCRGTSAWYLESAAYQQWRSPMPTIDIPTASASTITTPKSRLLLLQAKPGYGKTVLCAAIIEHCKPIAALQPTFEEPDDTVYHNPPATTFYFFEKQSQSEANSSCAFRAIATQLLHAYQDDRRSLDSAILLQNGSSSGQITAPDTEVRALIKLYLHQRPGTSIVIDGVDECSDYESFVQQLSEMVAGTCCRLFLSCRPTVSIHGSFQGCDTVTTHLQNDENMQDIQSYVRREIHDLVAQQKLDGSDSSERIVSEICVRSRSMFLWASLMIAYLKSDFLTPEDRHNAITELNTFEDLENIYLRILQSIKKQCKAEKAWTNVLRLFQWVTVALRPLQANELRTALAVQIGKPISKRNLLPDFENILTRISGALIEISRDCTVRFIHLSVLEFLTQANDSPLRVDIRTANYALGMECMSYLMHSVPGEPLSGSSQKRCHASDLIKRYPLLLYSTELWAYHTQDALKHHEPSAGDKLSRQRLVEMIHSFLSNRSAITVWTEASWTFGSTPQLHQLESQVGGIVIPFAKDLMELINKWGSTLMEKPNEIWEPSIPAFEKSRFWTDNSEANVASLATNVDAPPNDSGAGVHNEPLTIASQLSPDGTEVGVIKIWTSRLFSELHIMTMDDVARCSSGWYLNYTIARIDTQKNVLSMTFDIPIGNVFVSLRRAFRFGQPKKFSVPVCFSVDLRQIGVLGCLLRMVPSESPLNIDDHRFCSQIIVDMPVATDWHTDVTTTMFSEDIGYVESAKYSSTGYDWYGMRFSPDAKHLLIVRGREQPGYAYSSDYQLIILHDNSQSGEQPNFRYLAQFTTRTTTCMRENFVFHPFEPVLAISRVGDAVLWIFGAQPPQIKSISQEPLHDLEFPACGSFLHGIGIMTVRGLIIPLHTTLGWVAGSEICSIMHKMPCYSSRRGTSAAVHHKALAYHYLKTRAQESSALPAGQALVSQRNGESETMMLNSNTAGASIQHLDSTGNAINHDLVLLPSDAGIQSSYTTLLPSSVSAALGTPDKPVFGLVINKAMQDVYSLPKAPELQLPMVVTRTVESLPMVTGKRSSRGLEDGVRRLDGGKKIRMSEIVTPKKE